MPEVSCDKIQAADVIIKVPGLITCQAARIVESIKQEIQNMELLQAKKGKMYPKIIIYMVIPRQLKVDNFATIVYMVVDDSVDW